MERIYEIDGMRYVSGEKMWTPAYRNVHGTERMKELAKIADEEYNNISVWDVTERPLRKLERDEWDAH